MDQYFRRHDGGPITHISGFVDVGLTLDPSTSRLHYERRQSSAARRVSSYIVDHSIEGRALESNRHEDLLAYQLFDVGASLSLPDGEKTHIVDFQTPLAAKQGDGEGKIDLLGIGQKLWVVEFKILRPTGSADTPLMALFEAVGYAAVVEANLEKFVEDLAEASYEVEQDSIAVMVLAPKNYWDRWDASPAAHGWRESLRAAAKAIEQATGVVSFFGSFTGSAATTVEVVDALEPTSGGQPIFSQDKRRRHRRERTPAAASKIVEDQRSWARRNAVALADARHTADVHTNLQRPLSMPAREGILAGDGNELKVSSGPPRLSNLRSSTALSLNVFDPWVGHDLGPLTNSMGVDGASRIRFEVKFPTGLRGTSPNLDLVLDNPGGSGKPTAVEVKFVEPYDGQSNDFRPSYFSRDDIWDGMPRLRDFAAAISTNEISFQRLKAAQLIKHSLGLRREYGSDGFVLVYLWYDYPGSEADLHREEINTFLEVARGDIDARSLTFEELLAGVVVEPASGYFKYLRDRYRIGDEAVIAAGEASSI